MNHRLSDWLTVVRKEEETIHPGESNMMNMKLKQIILTRMEITIMIARLMWIKEAESDGWAAVAHGRERENNKECHERKKSSSGHQLYSVPYQQIPTDSLREDADDGN